MIAFVRRTTFVYLVAALLLLLLVSDRHALAQFSQFEAAGQERPNPFGQRIIRATLPVVMG